MTVITEEATEEQQRVSAATPPVGGAKVPSPAGRAGKQTPVTPVSGIVDLTDGRGYLRTAGYRRSATDLPLTASQVRSYGLRKGDQIDGIVAVSASASASGNGNGKTSGNGSTGGSGSRARQAGLADVTLINGLSLGEARARRHFDDLTPIYPNERFRLEDGDPSPAARIIDLVSPIGKGQRGLIVAPPKAGKTTVLKTIAHAVAEAHPEVHLMLVLVGDEVRIDRRQGAIVDQPLEFGISGVLRRTPDGLRSALCIENSGGDRQDRKECQGPECKFH